MGDDEISASDGLATALLSVTDMFKPVLEATLGYKSDLEVLGMSSDAASLCAADYHHAAMEMMLSGIRQAAKIKT